jgi:cytochrome c
MTRRTLLLLVAALAAPFRARAQEVPDLKEAPDKRAVKRVEYRRGLYQLTFHDGNKLEVMEMNLRIKTDGGPRGPRPGRPVVLPSGMGGDRFFLIFSAPEEISPFIQRAES